MEIVVVLVLLSLIAVGVLRAVHSDGRGRTPLIHSHAGWGNPALPSGPYSGRY